MKFILKLFKTDVKKKRISIIKHLVDAVDQLEENSKELEIVNHGLRDQVIRIEDEIDSNFETIVRNDKIVEGLKSIGF